MKTTATYKATLIVVLLLAGRLGLLLVAHVTSSQEHRCEKESIDNISVIKLI